MEASASDHQAIDLGVIEEMDVFVGICSVCEHGLLQDTLVQCGTCTNAVCPGCSEDGTCQRCMLARSRQQKRKAVDDAQEALAKRMVWDSDNRLQPLQVADSVVLVPMLFVLGVQRMAPVRGACWPAVDSRRGKQSTMLRKLLPREWYGTVTTACNHCKLGTMFECQLTGLIVVGQIRPT